MCLKKISFLLLAILIFSCTEEKIIPGKVPELPSSPHENISPTPFEVTIKELTNNSAIINWGPVYDLDGDILYHSVYLNGSVIVKQESDFALKISGLLPETSYTGKIVVTDSISEPRESSFSFTTKKNIIRFDKLYNNYNGKIPEGLSIEKTNDGGFIIACNSSFDHNGYGLFVLKLDSLGYEQWGTEIGNHHEIAFDGTVIQAKDNGFVIVNQATITKLSSNGDLQWQHPSSGWTHLYNSVIETEDFGYMVVGMKGGAPSKGTITKLDVNGNQIWEKFFDGDAPITMSSCSQIVKVAENEYLIAGTHQKPTIDFELAVARINASGDIYWTKIYEHLWQTFYMGIEIKKAGDVFIIGSTSLEVNNTQHARMVKIDENGSLLWDNTFEWGPFKTTCKAIASLEDGSSLFVGGYTDELRNEVAILVKLDSNGDFLWKKDFTPTYQDFVWEFRGLNLTPDGGLALMGIKAWTHSGAGKETGLWVLKTDGNGD